MVGKRQAEGRGHLDAEIRFSVDLQLSFGQPALEHVPAGSPVRCYEVEVVAGDVQALSVVGNPETYQATPNPVQLEDGLVLYDLHERRVGFPLAGQDRKST